MKNLLKENMKKKKRHLLEINIFNNAKNQKYNINTLNFIKYIDKRQCEYANILP